MRSFNLSILACLFTAASFAQAPEGVNYQAILRDGSGAIQANTSSTLGLAILQGSTGGPVVYAEDHAVPSPRSTGPLGHTSCVRVWTALNWAPLAC